MTVCARQVQENMHGLAVPLCLIRMGIAEQHEREPAGKALSHVPAHVPPTSAGEKEMAKPTMGHELLVVAW